LWKKIDKGKINNGKHIYSRDSGTKKYWKKNIVEKYRDAGKKN